MNINTAQSTPETQIAIRKSAIRAVNEGLIKDLESSFAAASEKVGKIALK